MNKICLMPKTLDEINLNVDAIIIGYKNYNSLNVLELDINEIKNIRKKYNKELYISFNKLIHDNEINLVEEILCELSKLEINGLLFDDLGVLQLVKEKDIDINLIWSNTHQVTNYSTINSYEKYGIKGAFISPDITLSEIIEIKENTNIKLFVPLFGKFEIFSSNRFLLTNYLKYINENKTNKTYYIENKDTKYPIYEDINGAHIINGNIINGLSEYIELLQKDIDYIIINSYDINNIELVVDSFNKVRDMYINNIADDKEIKLLEQQLTKDINKGFLYTETIYKVKSDVNER